MHEALWSHLLHRTCYIATHQASTAERVWQRQHAARWGEHATQLTGLPTPPDTTWHMEPRAQQPDQDPNQQLERWWFDGHYVRHAHPEEPVRIPLLDDSLHQPSWRRSFRLRHVQERHMLCPQCGAPAVVPCVYGYPTQALLAAMSRGRVLLGGDYLIDQEPTWACKTCEAQFASWPF